MDSRSAKFKSSSDAKWRAATALVVFSCIIGLVSAQTPEPTLEPTPVPSVTSTESDPIAQAADREVLWRSFYQAQKRALNDFTAREKRMLKEMQAGHKAQREAWQKKAQEDRRKFFEENEHGPERREYVKDMQERRKAMIQMQTDEANQRKNEGKVRRSAFVEDLAARAREFRGYLDQGKQPPQNLWP